MELQQMLGLGATPKYDWASRTGTTPELDTSKYTPEQWQNLGALGAKVNDSGRLMLDGTDLNLSEKSGLGVGDWFSNNKSMIGAGTGLGQLGLGYLNYSANKKGLESDLASAEQARRLNEEAAQNKRNIQNKAQSSLRFA
jgi:hypothetical protein